MAVLVDGSAFLKKMLLCQHDMYVYLCQGKTIVKYNCAIYSIVYYNIICRKVNLILDNCVL